MRYEFEELTMQAHVNWANDIDDSPPVGHPKSGGDSSQKLLIQVWELVICLDITLPETNIAHENRHSQRETDLPTFHFQVLC